MTGRRFRHMVACMPILLWAFACSNSPTASDLPELDAAKGGEKGGNQRDAGRSNGPSSAAGVQLTVLLTDAPQPALASAEVTIGKMSLIPSRGNQEVVLTEDAGGPFDLLQLQNGVTETLADLTVPAGSYSQLRLVVTGASVTLASGTFPNGSATQTLKMPSAAQSGLKIQLRSADGATGSGNGRVELSEATTIVLDFDVSQNFRFQGNPDTPAGIKGVLFTPVIRATVLDQSGSISGTVTDGTNPLEGATVTGVLEGAPPGPGETNTTSAVTGPDGSYTLHFLQPGTYEVTAEFAGISSGPQIVDVPPATDVTGVDFVIPLGPVGLVFTTQPVTTRAGDVITVVVEAIDVFGNTVPSFADPVTVSIEPGTGAAGAVLTGTTTVTPTAGAAVFDDLSIATGGVGYVLSAASGTLVGTSDPFDITLIGFVTNTLDGTITIFDAVTNTVIATNVAVGASPTGATFTPDGRLGYVANTEDGTVSVVDVEKCIVVRTIKVGKKPKAVAVTPDGKSVYVTNSGDNTVSTFAADMDAPAVETIPVGEAPSQLTVTPDGAAVYVTNEAEATVSVINTATNTTEVAPIPVGASPDGLAVTPDGGSVYVANGGDGTVSVISTATNTADPTAIAVGDDPTGVTVSGSGEAVYVVNAGSDNVSVIDTETNTVTGSGIDVGPSPTSIAITPDETTAYVTNSGSNTVTVVDVAASEPVATIPVGNGPTAVALSGTTQ